MSETDRVVAVVSKIMGVPAEDVTSESSADTIAAWDSLRHMNLILALEEEFEISFDDEEIVELLTVGLIVETIRAKRRPA